MRSPGIEPGSPRVCDSEHPENRMFSLLATRRTNRYTMTACFFKRRMLFKGLYAGLDGQNERHKKLHFMDFRWQTI